MSSYVRRLEIRLMKRAGFTREKWMVIRDPATGSPKPVECKRGGEITDPDDVPIGRHWPTAVPARALPAKRDIASPSNPARGRRRGKRSKRWLANRRARA